MKKIKLTKGLQINKEAVAKLQEGQMNGIRGGAASGSCHNNSCNGGAHLEDMPWAQ